MSDSTLPPDVGVDFPFPEGLRVTRDRPLHLLLAADFAGSEHGRIAGALAEELVAVNAGSFDEVLAQARPEVSFTVADPVVAGGPMVGVALRFESIKDFRPDRVAEQFAATRPLYAARELIVQRLLGKLSADRLASQSADLAAEHAALGWLPAAVKAQGGGGESASVDALLDQFDLGGEAGEETGGEEPPVAPPPKSELGSVVSAAAAAGGGAQIPAGEASALRRALAKLDQQCGTWLNLVLHAPAVQRLEATWRSVALLVSKLDFRAGVRLQLLHAPRAQLNERLVAKVIDPVFDEGAMAPDVLLVDEQFGSTPADLEILDELAQHAASLPVVVLAGVGASFFGSKHAWQVPSLPAFINHFDQWQFAKYKTLRDQPYARFLGLVFGRALLRAPHVAARDGDLAFAFREDCVGERDLLWAGGPIIGACTLSASFAESGWPTGLVGRVDGFANGRGGPKGDKHLGPSDTTLNMERAQELAAVGLNAIIGYEQETRVVFCNGFSAARPARPEGGAILEISLPYQLFASRVSTLMLDLKPHLKGMAPEKLVAFVLTHVKDWLTVADIVPDEQQVSVQARPVEGVADGLELAVTVTAPPRILPGGVPVVVGYRVR
jgi:type VI secretion system protein ImpC